MGTKRSRKRQHLYVSIAFLILAVLSACIPCRQMPSEPPAQLPASTAAVKECAHLMSVSDRINRGDFEGAMKENQDILDSSPTSAPGDEALMDLGLLSAHYANPKKDYKKAMAYFMRIEKEFPGSPHVEEAKIWINVLQSFEKATQVDIEIEKKKKVLGK